MRDRNFNVGARAGHECFHINPIYQPSLIMLGRDHALLGALGYLVVAPMVLHDPSWQALGVGSVTSGAFALLPDLDEPGSTVSSKLGFISRMVSQVPRRVGGGHREGPHSLLFVALVAAAT